MSPCYDEEQVDEIIFTDCTCRRIWLMLLPEPDAMDPEPELDPPEADVPAPLVDPPLAAPPLVDPPLADPPLDDPPLVALLPDADVSSRPVISTCSFT